MTTIELEKNEILTQTRFRDTRKLYEYLHEYFLEKKLAEIEKEEFSSAMSFDDAMKSLDANFVGSK